VKALTLWPEWAWAVTHLGKNVENRSWVIPPGLYALHAGKRFNGEGNRPQHKEAGLLSVWNTAHKQRLTVDQANTLSALEFVSPDIPTSSIVGLIRVTGHTNYQHRGLWDSPMGWAAPGQIANHIELIHTLPTPIPCKGALGLWTVPDNITHTLETVCLPD
jgi:hypothetical protein